MEKYPLSLLKYLIPLILILALFSIYSGSTLYFLISFLFFIALLIIYYPFYRESIEIVNKKENSNIYSEESKYVEEKLNEALKGSAVAQRLIEERMMNILVEDISNRFNLDYGSAVEKILNNEINTDEKILEIFKKIYKRRYDMNYVVDGETFKNEIEKVIEYIGV